MHVWRNPDLVALTSRDDSSYLQECATAGIAPKPGEYVIKSAIRFDSMRQFRPWDGHLITVIWGAEGEKYAVYVAGGAEG